MVENAMQNLRPGLIAGLTAALLLSACGTDGVTFGAGAGGGGSVASNGSSGAGSSSTGSGSDAGSTGAGASSGSAGSSGTARTASAGSGAVLVNAAGASAATPTVLATPALAPVARTTNGTLGNLVTTGNAILPTATSPAQPIAAALPLTANAGATTLGGANGTQPVGVSLLSPAAANGTVASANLLSAGQTATAALTPSGASGTLPLTANLGTTTLGGGSQPVGVSLLSPTAADGTLASANLLSAGQGAGATVAPGGLTSTTGAVLGNLGAVNVANHDVISGTNPLLGVSALSGTQNSGSVASVGAAAANQPVNLGLGNTQILPTGH
jgi:hypothetical protein